MAEVDVWADDYDPEIEGVPAPPRRTVRHPHRPPVVEHKTNTKTADADRVRGEVMREAQGKTKPEPDEWRQHLAAGERGKAISGLLDGGVTHNADSGFGLAGAKWWEKKT
jgi:hypothetical protein